MSTKQSDDEFGWSPTTSSATKSVNSGNGSVEKTFDSAFTEPVMIEDIAPKDDAQSDEDLGNYAPASDQPEVVASVKPRPNMAILALTGVLGIGLLGGAGWLVSKQFSKPGNSQSPQVAIAAAASPVTLPAASVFPTDAPSSPPSSQPLVVAAPAASSLTDLPPASTTNVFDTAPAFPAPAASAASVTTPLTVNPVSTAQSSSSSSALTPSPSKPASPASPVAVSQNKAAELLYTPPLRRTGSVVVAETANSSAVPVVSGHKTGTEKRLHKAGKTGSEREKSVNTASVALEKTTKISVKQKRYKKQEKAVVIAQRSEPVEDFALPRGMQVRSIFPISGPDAQAWIADANGKVEIVRVGESLRNGATVLKIAGVKGEVVTSAGVLTTRRGVQ